MSHFKQPIDRLVAYLVRISLSSCAVARAASDCFLRAAGFCATVTGFANQCVFSVSGVFCLKGRLMTSTISASPTAEEVLARVEQIAPVLRGHSSESDEFRRVSDDVVPVLHESGFYKLARPRAAGGLELDPTSILRVVEALSRYDSGVGWSVGASTQLEHLVSWISDEGAQEILGTPDVAFAGALNASEGKAVPVEGGYRVSGRWSFGSGCYAAKWLLTTSVIVDEQGVAQSGPGGRPQTLLGWVRAADVVIHTGSWRTLGMRGSGSEDFSADEVFLPARHVALMVPGASRGSGPFGGPFYTLTVWPSVGLLAAPALGTARAAIDEFTSLAKAKSPANTGSSVAERQVVQRQIAQAEAQLGAGRAYLFSTFDRVWASVVGGAAVSQRDKISMQLASTHAVACAKAAVDLVFAAGGTSSIRDDSSLQRYFRDVHTNTQHAYVSEQRYESTGALLLERPSDWGFFAL